MLKAGEEVWPFEGLFILKVLWLLAHTALYNKIDAFSSLIPMSHLMIAVNFQGGMRGSAYKKKS